MNIELRPIRFFCHRACFNELRSTSPLGKQPTRFGSEDDEFCFDLIASSTPAFNTCENPLVLAFCCLHHPTAFLLAAYRDGGPRRPMVEATGKHQRSEDHNMRMALGCENSQH